MDRAVTVECACCKKVGPIGEAFGLYVGMGGTHYICLKCQKLPFIEVMKSLDRGKVYVEGKPIQTLLEGKRGDKVK